MTEDGRPETARLLGLEPHPEGGWYRETWTAGGATPVQPDGYPGERRLASGIHFLLEPRQESRWHKVRSDELWLWHRGGPLLLSLGGTGAAPDRADVTQTVLGPDLAAGQRPQALVPGGHWQAARPYGREEVLVSCVVSPAFDFADFVLEEPPTTRAEVSAELPVSYGRAWPLVADFDAIASWHPLIARSEPEPGLPPGAPGHVRRLVTRRGETVRERLLALDEGRCVYEFAQSPFAVRAYRATLALGPGPDEATCRARWTARFTPSDPGQGPALRDFFAGEVFAPGLAALAEAARA
jgi:predicted cupin superfamily sugar epimerase